MAGSARSASGSPTKRKGGDHTSHRRSLSLAPPRLVTAVQLAFRGGPALLPSGFRADGFGRGRRREFLLELRLGRAFLFLREDLVRGGKLVSGPFPGKQGRGLAIAAPIARAALIAAAGLAAVALPARPVSDPEFRSPLGPQPV